LAHPQLRNRRFAFPQEITQAGSNGQRLRFF